MKQLPLVVVLSLLAVPVSALAEDELAEVDRAAPMFRLPVYNAKPVGATVVGLDKYVGPDATEKDVKVVLLSFMASFCAPCKKEMPYLQFLHERYREFGLRVVSISIDTEPEGQKVIDELIEQNKVTYPVLKDRFNLVARRWLGNQSPLPSVFLVRPDATVSNVHRGYNQDIGTVLATEIEAALGIKRLGAPPAMPTATAEATPAVAGGTGEVKQTSGTAPAPAAESKTTRTGAKSAKKKLKPAP
ncbi:MAG TPA: TlpA disulfide reductase family protein [Myxococcales bacterium]|nr:TlpA disulfide reductase family protein [Myxococcales bacterium]